MISKYRTIDNKTYLISPKLYKIKWAGKSASNFEWQGKKFFYYLWKDDLCCEEFPCRPRRNDRFRIDLFNFTKKIAVEFHGDQHVKEVKHYHREEDDFWKGVERDELKRQWCEVNKVQLIEIYQKNMPITIEWLQEKYPKILWK